MLKKLMILIPWSEISDFIFNNVAMDGRIKEESEYGQYHYNLQQSYELVVTSLAFEFIRLEFLKTLQFFVLISISFIYFHVSMIVKRKDMLCVTASLYNIYLKCAC